MYVRACMSFCDHLSDMTSWRGLFSVLFCSGSTTTNRFLLWTLIVSLGYFGVAYLIVELREFSPNLIVARKFSFSSSVVIFGICVVSKALQTKTKN